MLEEIAEVKEKKRALEAAIKNFKTDIEEYSLKLKKKTIWPYWQNPTPLE